jgi:hypothetical protein
MAGLSPEQVAKMEREMEVLYGGTILRSILAFTLSGKDATPRAISVLAHTTM